MKTKDIGSPYTEYTNTDINKYNFRLHFNIFLFKDDQNLEN
jgi:hypothetical protein